MHALSHVSQPITPNSSTLAGSDEQLVARALQGEQRAFEAIMRRHNRLLFRVARGVVSDDGEAQDVVQETYLRVFTRLQDFEGNAALGTWMARIAINLALDVLRKQGRTVPTDAHQDVNHEPSPEHQMSFSAPQSASPESVAARTELRALLQRAIESLPPLYRSVFMLRAVQEMSVDETAYCLQVSDAVVKTRYLRARAMLRDTLGAHIEADTDHVFAFAGERCDRVVRHVMAELEQRRIIQRP